MSDVFLYDTTLRDGSQREGISYSVDDKLKIVRQLDEIGVHYIEEAGPGPTRKMRPSSNAPGTSPSETPGSPLSAPP